MRPQRFGSFGCQEGFEWLKAGESSTDGQVSVVCQDGLRVECPRGEGQEGLGFPWCAMFCVQDQGGLGLWVTRDCYLASVSRPERSTALRCGSHLKGAMWRLVSALTLTLWEAARQFQKGAVRPHTHHSRTGERGARTGDVTCLVVPGLSQPGQIKHQHFNLKWLENFKTSGALTVHHSSLPC